MKIVLKLSEFMMDLFDSYFFLSNFQFMQKIPYELNYFHTNENSNSFSIKAICKMKLF